MELKVESGFNATTLALTSIEKKVNLIDDKMRKLLKRVPVKYHEKYKELKDGKLPSYFQRNFEREKIEWDRAEDVPDLINMVEWAEFVEFADYPNMKSLRCSTCYMLRPSKKMNQMNNKYGKQFYSEDLSLKKTLTLIRGYMRDHHDLQTHQAAVTEIREKILRKEQCGRKVCRLAYFVIMENLADNFLEKMLQIISLWTDVGDWRHGRQQMDNYLHIFFALHCESVIRIIKTPSFPNANVICIDVCMDKVSKKKVSSEIFLLGKIYEGERKEIILDLKQREYSGNRDVIGIKDVAQMLIDIMDEYEIELTDLNNTETTEVIVMDHQLYLQELLHRLDPDSTLKGEVDGGLELVPQYQYRR